MNRKNTILTGAILGFLAVAVGAFGAHALKGILEANGRTETFELATRYQFYHALALLAVALLSDKYPRVLYSGWLFLAGIILFSGSLYILSLTGIMYWGAVTPLGGISFLAGWMTLGWAVWKQQD
ncbi:MAG: DUF423 domain-containing protein [Bacteroidetes bacterium]|nr:DUF423 domain-containing protein [Bacteroidota bacterium]